MKLKEYSLENDQKVSLDYLKSSRMSEEEYKTVHKSLVIPCHDIIIQYNYRVLLVERKEHPAKGIPWPIGGRIERGFTTEESLKKKVKEESNLDLEDIIFLGIARTFFKTDPFFHEKGTDTLNLMFFGRGSGSLKLDDLHTKPIILDLNDYPSELKKTLHPYVQDLMDLAIPFINNLTS